MREAQEIEDEEHEQILERVCAIDVAKASGMVCTRVPHPSRAGRRVQKVWSVPARFAAVSGLAEELVDAGVERVVLESDSGTIALEMVKKFHDAGEPKVGNQPLQ
jgi:hypothetical protein